MTAQSIGGRAAAEPELCRVSVIGGDTQLDVGLPATVPVAAFIGDLVALIESRNPRLPDQEDGGVPSRPQHWTLARLGRNMIAPGQTLGEADVHDGELLVLRPVAAKESPALFDDVIDAVARLTAEEFRGWSAGAARWTGLIAAVVAMLATLGLAAASRATGDRWVVPSLLTGFAVAALVSAVIVARRYGDELTATVLTACMLLSIFGGAALFVPGALGSPHLLLGSAAALLLAVIGYRLIGTGPSVVAAVVTMVTCTGIAAAVSMVWDPGLPKIAAGLLVGALLLISLVPRMAAGLARLPVPPVPTAGGAIDPADHEPRPTIEGIGAIGATVLPSAAGLGQRARIANHFQTGMLFGCAVLAGLGALGSVGRFGASHWQGAALALVTAIVLCLRGRAFADLAQAAVLISGGALVFVGLSIQLAVDDSRLVPVSVGLLLLFAVAVIGFGVVGPHVEVSPVVRRFDEIVEYLLIVLVVPLVMWVMDVYTVARNL
ncbi:type VII secretion integral membrane protein EccD [Nocardia sp. BMG111209]|uniref:type VII secretion integral membrane protein EccD n=1 Tax=Nocardia sp. BMG111209 TaxID=1160137 RepID=UPI000362655A|nr:type VII secretion integral membrane protein EccD [Nocardia sp. BMG111209]